MIPFREVFREKKEVPKIICRCDGTAPKYRRVLGSSIGLGKRADYDGREIPSFCILDWRVVRFIPSLAAAPAGPPMVHSDSRSALRICSRSACSSVVVTELVV